MGGLSQAGDILDRLELVCKLFYTPRKCVEMPEISGRFGQESPSFEANPAIPCAMCGSRKAA